VLLAVAFAGLLGSGISSASAAVSPAALRVVSGTPVAQITSFPFQVALFIQGQTGPYGQ